MSCCKPSSANSLCTVTFDPGEMQPRRCVSEDQEQAGTYISNAAAAEVAVSWWSYGVEKPLHHAFETMNARKLSEVMWCMRICHLHPVVSRHKSHSEPPPSPSPERLHLPVSIAPPQKKEILLRVMSSALKLVVTASNLRNQAERTQICLFSHGTNLRNLISNRLPFS